MTIIAPITGDCIGPCIGSVFGDTFDYFIDADSGSDGNAGTSPSEAWKSLGRIVPALLAIDTTVRVRVAAGTYDTINDYIELATGNTATDGAVLDLVFEHGCTIDGSLQTTKNGVEASGNIPWTLNIYGNNLTIQNFDDPSTASPNGVGNRGVQITNVHDVQVTACADGFSAHNDATLSLYDCSANECSKSPFVHVTTGIVEAYRCEFVEKVGGGTMGLSATDVVALPNIKCYDCKFIPDITGTAMLYNGELHRCQLGTLDKSLVAGNPAGGHVKAYDSFINLYVDGNKTWTLDRCFGRFSYRVRNGGEANIQRSVIAGAAGGQSQIVFANYDPGSGSKLIMSNNIFETDDTFMSVGAANAGYLVASASEFHNNILPDGQSYDADLVAADVGGTVIQGTVDGDPLIGSADDLSMASYGFNVGSPAEGAGTTGDIGFAVGDAQY